MGYDCFYLEQDTPHHSRSGRVKLPHDFASLNNKTHLLPIEMPRFSIDLKKSCTWMSFRARVPIENDSDCPNYVQRAEQLRDLRFAPLWENSEQFTDDPAFLRQQYMSEKDAIIEGDRPAMNGQ